MQDFIISILRVIFSIPLGVYFVITIGILLILRNKKKCKKNIINKIIYILVLSFIGSILYAFFKGYPYPCSCGVCGSQRIAYGFNGIIAYFTKTYAEVVIEEFEYFFPFKILVAISIHIFILIIKFILNKMKKHTKNK